MMMMMFVPNFLVRQKEGAQKEEKEEARGRRKAGSTGTSTPGAVGPIGPIRSGLSDARNRKKTWMVVWGTNPHERQRGLRTSPFLSR